MGYKKRGKHLAIITLTIGLVVSNLPIIKASALENNENVEVQLLSFNDLHGQFDSSKYGGGIANLSAYIKKLRSENKNTLTLSAGDAIGGSPAVTALKQDQPTLEIMEEIGVNIATTGNHEYDEGTDELARLVQGGTHSSGLQWKGSSFDWVTANVVAKEDMKFGNKEIKKGEPILDPYQIKEFDGVKVGVIGIVTTEAKQAVIPDGIKNVEFLDEAQTIDKYTDELVKQGVKTIVVLSHVAAKSDNGELLDLAGNNDAYDIANKVNGEVDVIIGAHSHQYANAVVKREGKDDILVTQANSKGTSLTDTDLTISKETGDVVGYKRDILTVSPETITADPKVASMVGKYEEDVKPLLERKVGYAEEEINRNLNNNGESELGRMIAKAQLWAVKEKGKDVQISLMNTGGVRADLNQGDVTYKDIYTIQPFGNDLTTLTLTGSQLKEILEKQNIHDWVEAMQAGKYERPIMLQIDGFTYKWHPEKVHGKWNVKVDSITLNDENKTPVTADMKLNTVANIFLAQGGDGFDTFKQTSYEVVMGDLEAFENYVTAFSNKDTNNNGTNGLNNVGIEKNQNSINLDKNFDGIIDNPDQGNNELTDINGHWAEKEIKDFAQKGHVIGYEDNTFKPENPITRAEFVKIVNKVYGFNDKGIENFNDVNEKDWFYDDVCIGVKAGYIKGRSADTFAPNDNITRQEVAMILTNIGNNKDSNIDKLENFKDGHDVDGWAKEAIEGAIEAGYIKGYEDTTIRAKGQTTRAEAVSMLSRVK